MLRDTNDDVRVAVAIHIVERQPAAGRGIELDSANQ